MDISIKLSKEEIDILDLVQLKCSCESYYRYRCSLCKASVDEVKRPDGPDSLLQRRKSYTGRLLVQNGRRVLSAIL
jgi:hypothetical protein